MRRPALAATAALLLLVAGCAEQTSGSPSPGDEPTSTSTEQTTTDESTESSTERPEDSGLADVHPCDTVDETARSGLGLDDGVEKKYGEARVCVFRKEGATLNDSFNVQVEIYDTRGISDIVATDTQELPKIGGHDAAQYTGTTGGCAVSLGVTEESRVDATAVGGDAQQGCAIATQLATIVEPNLP